MAEATLPAARAGLRADCSRCFGLCCAGPGFSRSADFAFTKPPGEPCRHLRVDFGCGVHERLRDLGMPGCTTYDCFGADQHVAQSTFGGRDWRARPETATAMFAALTVVRGLHELLWYLAEAADLDPGRAADVRAAYDQTRRLCDLPAAELGALDLDAHRGPVTLLLRQVSDHARRGLPGAEHRGADLLGRRLRGADLRGADLRGALLVGADLRGAVLHRADVTGADLRGTDVRGCDLRSVLFLTQQQAGAARGDAATRLPAVLARPGHWSRPEPVPAPGRSRARPGSAAPRRPGSGGG